MKYTLKEMCNNALKQDLATHDMNNLWDHYYLLIYTAKELIEQKSSILSTADYAAINALVRDWDALTVDDQYLMFKECRKDTWHGTVLALARKYMADTGDAFLKHCHSAYLSSIRMLDREHIKETHNDPSLIILQFDDSVRVIPDNCYSNNKNLSTLIFGKNIYRIGEKSFAGCDNLSKVYIENQGEVIIEDGAIPSTAEVIIFAGGNVSSNSEELKKEYDAKIRELESETATLKSSCDKLIDEKGELLKSVEELKQNNNSELQKENDELKSKISSYEADMTKAIKELEDAKAGVAGLTERLSISNQELASVTAKRDEVSSENASLLERINVLTNEQGNLIREKENALSTVSELELKLADKESEFDALLEQVGEANDTEDSLNETIEEYSKQISSLQQSLEEKDAQISSLSQPKENEVAPYVAKLIVEMLPNGQAAIDKAKTDEHFAYEVLPTMYEKCCILRYKFDVQKLERSESLDAKIAMLSKGSENDYTRAMASLKLLKDNGKLSSRHLEAIREMVGEPSKAVDCRDRIIDTLEKHGYSESDYDEKYEECLNSVNKTELKYTAPTDVDKLVADRMEEYLSKPLSLEDAIRKHKGLDQDADVSQYIESLKMMKEIMSSSIEGMSEEEALLSLVSRLP